MDYNSSLWKVYSDASYFSLTEAATSLCFPVRVLTRDELCVEKNWLGYGGLVHMRP